MINVYLLKDYREHSKGDIVSVSNNVAFGLIESSIGRHAINQDFMVKPEIGSSKAFKRPPSKAFVKKSKGAILDNK